MGQPQITMNTKKRGLAFLKKNLILVFMSLELRVTLFSIPHQLFTDLNRIQTVLLRIAFVRIQMAYHPGRMKPDEGVKSLRPA